MTADDILHALERGLNFLNWPGFVEGPDGADAFSEAIRSLGKSRESVVVRVQFGARTAIDAAAEMRSTLSALRTDYVDVLTLYYVEHEAEWAELNGTGGVLDYLRAAKNDGIERRIGVTSHQRLLGQAWQEADDLMC
jgi:predicted aldo/keto reductase-like oxidoreductase